MKCNIITLILFAALIGSLSCFKIQRKRKIGRKRVDLPPGWKNKVVSEFLKEAKGYDMSFSRELGEGSYGYVVDGKYNGARVAIKFVYNKDLETETLTKSEIKQTEKAASESNFTIPICDSGKFGNKFRPTYFITLPFAERDLYKEIKNNPQTFIFKSFRARKLKSVIQMARAVHELHSQSRIIHRDIKPENFLKMPDGRVVLADFGFAIDERRTKFETQIAGTPMYLPRDFIITDIGYKKFNLTPEVDVFALGVTMAEYLIPQFTTRRDTKYDALQNPFEEIFYSAAEDFKEKWRNGKGKYLDEKNAKLVDLIFDRMLIPNLPKEGKTRISSADVYMELSELFPELVSEVDTDFNNKPNYCSEEHKKQDDNLFKYDDDSAKKLIAKYAKRSLSSNNIGGNDMAKKSYKKSSKNNSLKQNEDFFNKLNDKYLNGKLSKKASNKNNSLKQNEDFFNRLNDKYLHGKLSKKASNKNDPNHEFKQYYMNYGKNDSLKQNEDFFNNLEAKYLNKDNHQQGNQINNQPKDWKHQNANDHLKPFKHK